MLLRRIKIVIFNWLKVRKTWLTSFPASSDGQKSSTTSRQTSIGQIVDYGLENVRGTTLPLHHIDSCDEKNTHIEWCEMKGLPNVSLPILHCSHLQPLIFRLLFMQMAKWLSAKWSGTFRAPAPSEATDISIKLSDDALINLYENCLRQ